jgi:hypothetical protein
MQAAVAAIETSSRNEVLVFAPSSSAVSVLKSEGFSKSDTFQMFEKDPLLQDVARGQVLWVDEAGFLSVRQMNWLVQFAAKNDCRVILSGDTRQHHSVDRGDGMRLLEESGCVAKAGLRTIIRQRVEELRSAVTDLSRVAKPLRGLRSWRNTERLLRLKIPRHAMRPLLSFTSRHGVREDPHWSSLQHTRNVAPLPVRCGHG